MKDYLGDSVYAEFDGYSIILTTDNGFIDDPMNTIIMEPMVLAKLDQFRQRIKDEQQTKKSSDKENV